jgi:hypothetical protein
MSGRSSQYMQGRREALKWAITFLHAKAEEMNDPKAWRLLNLAASDIGNEVRGGQLRKINRKSADRWRHFYHTRQLPNRWWQVWRW